MSPPVLRFRTLHHQGSFVFLALLLISFMALRPTSAADFDRPTGASHQSRSMVIAEHGMVATSQPLAVQAGLEVLQSGGNAVDAAIAANAMLAVVEPMSCGIGGDLFVLYWDAETQQLYGLNASGRAPMQITPEVFTEQELTAIPLTGPLCWSVPGCVDGWEELRSRFGTKPLAELLAPAIYYAEEGFPVSEVIASHWVDAQAALSVYPDSASTWLIDGQPPAVGEIFRNPNMAASLRLIAEQGPDAFYRGPIAEEIVSFSEANGGYFSLEDFANHRSQWVDPVSTNYRGYDVWELPPNGQGIAVLQMLNILEAYDIAELGHNSTDYLHLLIEAKKLAFADRAKFYADPDFADVPIEELISEDYAALQRRRIDPNVAAVDVAAGNPLMDTADTVYLSVVDGEGNCCSLIQSNFHGFGSKMTPGNLGFTLQNRGALFSLDPEHPNCLEPGKRPFHTIIPAMVTKDGQPWLCFGVMGGDMQPQGQVQVLLNMIDFGMNVQAAGDAARIRHDGSATPTGDPMTVGGGVIVCESGIPEEVVAALVERGHKLTEMPAPGGHGGYQGIMIHPEFGTLFGGTDSRKDGCAAGY